MTRLGFLMGLSTLMAACAPEVHVEDAPSGSSSSSTGTGGEGQGGMGGGGSTGVGAAPVVPCSPSGDPQAELPLCGPGDAPCQVIEDEVLPDPPAFRNDAPGIALASDCRPRILFSRAVGKYDGFFAFRETPGNWSILPMPFAYASGALISVGDGLPVAIPNDGAFGASIWSFTAEGWKKAWDVPGSVTHIARGVATTPEGQVLGAYVTDASKLAFSSWGPKGTSLDELGGAVAPVPLALSPQGDPHIVSWEWIGDQWKLVWHSPPDAPEVVMTFDTVNLASEAQRPVIGVTAKDANNPRGKPHVLSVRALPDGTNELVYITRSGKNSWSVVPIVIATQAVVVAPLGFVTDNASNIRLFYARRSPVNAGEGYLEAVWPTSDQSVQTAIIVEKTSTWGATFVRDGIGRIHVASYEFTDTSNSTVRYLLLSP